MTQELLDYFKGDELAASVWLNKYAQEGETTPDDMHNRLATEFAKVEEKYFISEPNQYDAKGKPELSDYAHKRKPLTKDVIYNLFKDFKYIIPQGSVMSQLGSKNIGSLSNCFVVGQPIDSYGGIFHKDQELAQLMKRRGGVGIDISTLRPEGTETSNAAKSSTGAVSFMHRFSNTTREVAQKGRRGALMISIDINHPDVMEFIKIKRDLSQVTGANISIKLNNEFMKAVENDEDYILRFPCDVKINDSANFTQELNYDETVKATELPSYIETEESIKNLCFTKVKAKEYWDEIIKSAHNVAEPGLMFWDSMVNYSPDGVYDQFRQITTNPCSEIGMQPYDACRLIAVNLFSFVEKPFTKEAEFNFEKFLEINYEAMRLSDNLIDLEVKHIDRIIEKIQKDVSEEIAKGELLPEGVVNIYKPELDLWNKVKETALSSRRTGLGITGLGDALAAVGLKYDSDEALCMIENIMDTKMASELDCTTDLAILRGTFKDWNPEQEFNIVEEENWLEGANEFYAFILNKFPEQTKKMLDYGRRNISWSTIAPTGSLSIMAKALWFSNISSGLEPQFMCFYMRRKKVNPGEEGSRVDFTDQNGDSWQEYPVLMGAFKSWIKIFTEECGGEPIDFNNVSKGKIQSLYELSPWYEATANDINWVRRVEIQGMIQKYITHSISSTINLPNDVTEAEVSEIYLESWKKGLKGITVYRDGSRSGVLVSADEKPEEQFNQYDAPKRPETLDASASEVIAEGKSFNVIVGTLDGKPYEIFVDVSANTIKGEGIIFKKASGEYFFKQKDIVLDITGPMSDEQEVITRLISTSLRHGANIKFIVEQLNKTSGAISSYSKAIARVLKSYIPEGEKSTVSCNSCGSSNVIFEEGCNKCQDCGDSKCG